MRLQLIISLVASLALPAAALAQGGPGPGAGAGRAGAGSNFDPTTVTTVSGTVTAVRKIDGAGGQGVHVDLKADSGTYDVHLGPSSFLEGKSFEVKTGDRLEVTGSKVDVGGNPALIAQSVKRGDATLTLRDVNGVPAWARGAKKKR